MGKLHRFHKDIHFPAWTDESFEDFHACIYSTGPLTFSLHSVEKMLQYYTKYGRFFFTALHSLVTSGAIVRENLFEFYSPNKTQEMSKACFRFSVEGFPEDIVLVIARNCTILTVYLVDKDATFRFLNRSLYYNKKKGK